MSDQPHTTPDQPTGAEVAHGDATGAELETRYENPGISPHAYRRSDIDPKAAKRREREVATLFGLSTLGTLLFIVGYFAVKLTGLQGDEMLEQVGLSTKLLGLGLGVALFAIGAGAIHWAKTLMPDDEVVNERKPMRSSDEDRGSPSSRSRRARAVPASGGASSSATACSAPWRRSGCSRSSRCATSGRCPAPR